jgi:hypothetical protein
VHDVWGGAMSRYKFVGRWPNSNGVDCYWWEGPRVDSRVEQVCTSVDWFWGGIKQ